VLHEVEKIKKKRVRKALKFRLKKASKKVSKKGGFSDIERC